MSSDDKLTAGDYRMIHYFIEEKGDITRWRSWPEKQAAVEREHPELIKALADLSVAESILKAVLKNLPSGDDEVEP